MPTRQGSIRLFQLFGITVYLHWAWFLAVAYFVHQARGYSSLLWSVAECFSLFLIVLIHEFGHQLACRSVGGKTHDIVLWVLGGVAYVSPPQRPGATLWSIAAGPLVNVVLFPLFGILLVLVKYAGWEDTNPNAFRFCLHALFHQRRPARFQPAADLSARWRTNFTVAALVCVRTREKSDDRQHHRVHWRGGV